MPPGLTERGLAERFAVGTAGPVDVPGSDCGEPIGSTCHATTAPTRIVAIVPRDFRTDGRAVPNASSIPFATLANTSLRLRSFCSNRLASSELLGSPRASFRSTTSRLYSSGLSVSRSPRWDRSLIYETGTAGGAGSDSGGGPGGGASATALARAKAAAWSRFR